MYVCMYIINPRRVSTRVTVIVLCVYVCVCVCVRRVNLWTGISRCLTKGNGGLTCTFLTKLKRYFFLYKTASLESYKRYKVTRELESAILCTCSHCNVSYTSLFYVRKAQAGWCNTLVWTTCMVHYLSVKCGAMFSCECCIATLKST